MLEMINLLEELARLGYLEKGRARGRFMVVPGNRPGDPARGVRQVLGTGRVTRENATAKGLRLLTEARLTVWRADGRRILAHCRGDSGEWYDVGYSRGSWYCSCPSFGRCSYLVALMRVTVRPGSALGFTNETETPAV
jgi:hypothetical protein